MKKNRYVFFCMALAAVCATSCESLSNKVEYIKRVREVTGGTSKTIGRDQTIPFVFRNREILFEAEVNGKKDTLMLDMGVNQALIRMVTEEESAGMEFVDMGVTTTESASLQMCPEPLDLTLGYLRYNSFTSVVLLDEDAVCDSETRLSSHPLAGSPIALSYGGLELNFSQGEMRMFRDHWTRPDLTGYEEVKCKFPLTGVVKVFITVDGEERECLFDTGNHGGLILKDKRRAAKGPESDIHYEGSFGIALSGGTEHQQYCLAQGEPVQISAGMVTADVTFVSDIAMDNMGIKFISRFDWIFLSEQRKVYVRPRKIKPEPEEVYPYRITTTGGRITILSRCTDLDPQFAAGDVIQSVDGVPVTEENICDYFVLLKAEKDWSKYQIAVR